MKEGQTQTMTLDDIEAPIFGLFNNWMYTQVLVNEEGRARPLWNTLSSGQLRSAFSLRVPLERLFSPISSLLLQVLREQWGCTRSDFLNYTYLGAPEQAGSELRKIAVVMAAEQTKQDNIDKILGEIPEAMLIDFTKAVVVRIVSLPISQFIVLWRDLSFERRYDLSADFTQHTCNSVVTRKVHAIFFHFFYGCIVTAET
jgi:hypothetical protein